MFRDKKSQAIGWISMTDIFILFTVLLFIVIIASHASKNSEGEDGLSQACCIDDVCREITESICLDLYGDPYVGTCNDVICQSEEKNIPIVRLGCCFDNVICRDMSEEECLTNGGEFLRGDCDSYFALSCQMPLRFACCIGSICEELTHGECNELNGEFRKPFEYCNEVTCVDTTPNKYACCIELKCVEMTSEECLDLNGQVYSKKNCIDIICKIDPEMKTFACCVGAQCIELTLSECQTIGGKRSFSENDWSANCDKVICESPPSLVNCCVNGSCIELTEAECLFVGGLVITIDCKYANCPIPPKSPILYPCCIGSQCQELTQEQCDALNGLSKKYEDCSSVICIDSTPKNHACCVEGICIELTSSQCDILNGQIEIDKTCELVNCPKPKPREGLPVELLNLKPPLKNVLFLVDNSSGMAGAFGLNMTKWDSVVNTIELWLMYLPFEETAIITFNSNVKYAAARDGHKLVRLPDFSNKEARKKKIEVFTEFLSKQKPQRRTDMIKAFQFATKFTTSKGEKIDAIILFSDGKPTQDSIKKTINKLKEIPNFRDIPIHIIGTGNYFTAESKVFYQDLLKINGQGSWRGTDGGMSD